MATTSTPRRCCWRSTRSTAMSPTAAPSCARRWRSSTFDTPTGKVKLDKNRNAIADIFLTEVAEGADGNLYNKVVKVMPQVNQTLGIAEDEFLKLGVGRPRQPELPVDAARRRSAAMAEPVASPSRLQSSRRLCAGARRRRRGISARWWRSPASIMRIAAGERRAVLGSNGAGKTTLFNADHRRLPADRRPHPLLRRGHHRPAAARAHPARPATHLSDLAVVRRACRCSTAIFLACRGVSRRRLLAAAAGPRRRHHGAGASRSLHAGPSRAAARCAGGHAQPRPAAAARDRAGAGRRAALHPVRRAGGRAVADRAARPGRDPQRAARRISATSSSSTISTWRCASPNMCR